MAKLDAQVIQKIDELEGIDEGQAMVHQLPITRDWCQAMNALHHLFLRKWYYVGLVTNTMRNSNKLLKDGIEFSRRRESVDEGLRSILGLGPDSYQDIKNKIREQRIKSGQNKDVWHFASSWKELPKGTVLIEIHQSLLMTLLGKKGVRNAFLVLDGKSSLSDQNNAMFLIKKVFTDKDFTLKVLEQAKADKGKQPELTKAFNGANCRKPGSLLILLQNDFSNVSKTITTDEKALLDQYFDQLKLQGQHSKDHDKMQRSIERAFAKRA